MKAKYNALSVEKVKLYVDYQQVRDATKEYSTIKHNVVNMLSISRIEKRVQFPEK